MKDKTKIYITVIKRFIAVLSFLLLAGCARNELGIPEYIKYIEDPANGLLSEKSIGKLKYSAQYKPYEYVAVKESRIVFKSINELKKSINELNGTYFITFRIASCNNKSVPIEQTGSQDFNSRLMYCNSQMQNDFLLIDGHDTMPCSMFHFERNFGLAPYNNFLLGFEQKSPDISDLTLIYFDRIFNTGLLKFRISRNDIKDVPQIKDF